MAQPKRGIVDNKGRLAKRLAKAKPAAPKPKPLVVKVKRPPVPPKPQPKPVPERKTEKAVLIQGPPGIQGERGFAGSTGTDGEGVPVGGSAGQILSKIDGDDYNTEWVTSGASTPENQLLVEWAQGKDYEPLVITRDSEGRVTSMTATWPDSSSGAYTATDYNATHEVYDGYTITHVDSSKTVTQSAVTRNAEGAITNKPALTVA